MKWLIPMACALVLLPIHATADNHLAQYWPEGSAMHTGRLAQERLAAADKELNRVYQALLKAMPEDKPDDYPRRMLIAAQRAWMPYRDATCNLKGELTGAVRMWKSAYTVDCLADVTQARTRELQNMLACATQSEDCRQVP